MLNVNIGRQRKKRRLEEEREGTKKRQEGRWRGKGLGEEGRLDLKHSLFFPKNVTGSLCAR